MRSRFVRLASLFIMLAAFSSSWACIIDCSPPSTSSTPLGEITGILEFVRGEPCSSCKVLLVGTNRSATTDAAGRFDVFNLEGYGPYHLVFTGVLPSGEEVSYDYGDNIGVTLGGITPLGRIQITQPVMISGQVGGISVSNYQYYFVTVVEQGTATPLSTTGTFFLNGVSPGRHKLELKTFAAPASTVASMTIDVSPRRPLEMFTGLAVVPVSTGGIKAPPPPTAGP
jgi:hypothetical protein